MKCCTQFEESARPVSPYVAFFVQKTSAGSGASGMEGKIANRKKFMIAIVTFNMEKHIRGPL